MNKRFGRRGVTLLETVIAMLLLTIITGTAFTVCSSAATSVARTGKEFAVINFCEDVVEYYKAASDKAAFDLLLGNVCPYDFTYAATDDGTTDESTLVFTLGAYGCKVTATLTRGEMPVTDGADNLDGVTLTVTAISLTNAGKTVHTTSYTKGGGNA